MYHKLKYFKNKKFKIKIKHKTKKKYLKIFLSKYALVNFVLIDSTGYKSKHN